MRYSTLYKIPIRIVTIFLLLSSLHPGNYLHGQEQPDTLSFYLPNILVTAIESKTPGTFQASINIGTHATDHDR